MTKARVLFLCTGNSCRSQMAEGWTRRLKGDVIEPYSAGIEKHGLNALAVKAMAEAGVDISHHESKVVSELPTMDFGLVVTVCGHAHESCPYFPGKAKVVHVDFDDPPKLAEGAKTEEEAMAHYRRVRDEIRAFVETLPDGLLNGGQEMKEEKAKKKGWLSIIRESMTKTGGCCGSGETCGGPGPAKEKGKETSEDKDAKGFEKDVKK